MSDSINQEQLRAKEILEHKTRVAVNMDKVKNDSITDYYSMENTQADILFIEQVLAQEELKQAALRSWQHYQETGLHLSGEEMDVWLARLEAGEHDAPMPQCHR